MLHYCEPSVKSTLPRLFVAPKERKDSWIAASWIYRWCISNENGVLPRTNKQELQVPAFGGPQVLTGNGQHSLCLDFGVVQYAVWMLRVGVGAAILTSHPIRRLPAIWHHRRCRLPQAGCHDVLLLANLDS